MRCARVLTLLIPMVLVGCSDQPDDSPVDNAVSGLRVDTVLGSDDSESGFLKAQAPNAFQFPSDHGAHPGYRSEWWYLTAVLNDALDHFVTKAIGVFVSDSMVIRQLVLASALGRASGSWHQVDPEEILLKVVSDMPADKRPVSTDPAVSARMMITYFRGALYGWAAGFYSDEEFEKQVRLAGRLSDPDAA